MIVFVQHKLGRVLLLFALTFLITFCTDDPTSIGDDLIPDGDKVEIKTISSLENNFSQTFSTFKKDSLYYGSSRRLLLGNYENLSIEMLLGFAILLPDSLKKQLDSNETILTKSWIEMQQNYWIGDSTQLSFSVHKINESWTSVQFDDDTLASIKSTMGGDILLPSTYSFTDSLITLQIDNEVVDEWVARTYDKDKPQNNGLLFSPISNTGILGFQALNALPSSRFITLKLVFEKQGSYIDTISSVPSIDIHSVTSTLPTNPTGSTILQSSSSVRGKLWFDVSEVPSDIIINKATLDLFIDEANTTQGNIKTDTVAIGYYELSEVNRNFGLVPLFKKDKSYSGDLRSFVQRWSNGDENEGVQVVLSDENRTASTIAFYNSSNAVDSLKPRLTIHYTKQK
ncbi:MAG: hypothetical protein V3V16_05050 [Melioribacteraceae bacterium]